LGGVGGRDGSRAVADDGLLTRRTFGCIATALGAGRAAYPFGLRGTGGGCFVDGIGARFFCRKQCFSVSV
jgi:hypothetical protein